MKKEIPDNIKSAIERIVSCLPEGSSKSYEESVRDVVRSIYRSGYSEGKAEEAAQAYEALNRIH